MTKHDRTAIRIFQDTPRGFEYPPATDEQLLAAGFVPLAALRQAVAKLTEAHSDDLDAADLAGLIGMVELEATCEWERAEAAEATLKEYKSAGFVPATQAPDLRAEVERLNAVMLELATKAGYAPLDADKLKPEELLAHCVATLDKNLTAEIAEHQRHHDAEAQRAAAPSWGEPANPPSAYPIPVASGEGTVTHAEARAEVRFFSNYVATRSAPANGHINALLRYIDAQEAKDRLR